VKIKFLPLAKNDFRDASAYYKEIDAKLAIRFNNEVNISIDRIIATPKLYMIIRNDIRKCVIHIFPYSIYYIVEENVIYIYAVSNHYKKFKI